MANSVEKILLLGSEPFGGLSRNPAQDVIARLRKATFGAAELVCADTPVSFNELPDFVDRMVAEVKPDIALGLGMLVGAASIRIETTAINRADFDVADNEGSFVRDTAFEPGDAEARRATYDATGLASYLRTQGIPARTSHHAGTHLCNLTFYYLLKAQERIGTGIGGFVHLPLLPKQAAELIETDANTTPRNVRIPVEYPSLCLETQVTAIRLLLEKVVGQAADLAATPAHSD